MRPRGNAVQALVDLVSQVQCRGLLEHVKSPLLLIDNAIKGLERSPEAKVLMAHLPDWPAFVPGGPRSGPKWKSWAKSFELRRIGSKNTALPTEGSADMSPGSSAGTAEKLFQELNPLRG